MSKYLFAGWMIVGMILIGLAGITIDPKIDSLILIWLASLPFMVEFE